eukprot:NODE_508_length_7458_cov_0.132491.p8 type:complete len:148 gc:universal NODE_508_length_7458_cov_0.132491:4738-4295(-)
MISKLVCKNRVYHILSLSGIYKGLRIICTLIDNTLKITVIPFHPAISEEGAYNIQRANENNLSMQVRLQALMVGLSFPKKENVINSKAQLLLEVCPKHFNQLVQTQILMTNRILKGFYALPNPYKDDFDFEKYRKQWESSATIEIRK